MDESASALNKHRIPVIDRMMDLLAMLERRANGATIRELTALLALPRTTVYRILNTLQIHDMVRRSTEGDYRLGPRLLTLASRAVVDIHGFDLATIARPHLERLSAATGEASKISVLDGGTVLVCATIEGKREYALTVVSRAAAAPSQAERVRIKRPLEQARGALRALDTEMADLEHRIHKRFHTYWGSLLKEANETSSFGNQVEEYACLYTSKVSNFASYSPLQHWRSPRDVMPHEM